MKNFTTLYIFLIYMFFSGVSIAEDTEKSQKIIHMSSQKIASFVESTKGAKRVVMIYASWCPYCIKAMPQIMDIERVKPGSIIAISQDEDHIKFARYIKRQKNIPFHIFLTKSGLEGALQNTLGVKPWTGFPTYIFLDADNKVVAQGNYDVDKIAAFVLEE